MKPKNLFQLLVCTSFLMACSTDNPDTLMEDTPTPPTGGTTITYRQNVKSIIDNNCISCHGATPRNGTSLSLSTYAQVKNAMENRGLLNRISLNNGNSALMPQGGPRLPQTTIDVVAKWQQDGLLE
ncbi:cytochrome c [Flavobacterium sp. FZUC8N2.13]|uniref:Cytochrome c n=1 Tax=Flavobacterium zubiriense TaxID=3138075 RepID=A0ABV4TFZ2_9FLAO